MAPQHSRQRKGGDSPTSIWSSEEYNGHYLPTLSIEGTVTATSMADPTSTTTSISSEYDGGPYAYPPAPSRSPQFSPPPDPWTNFGPSWSPQGQSGRPSWTTTTSPVAQPDNQVSASTSTTPALVASYDPSSSTSATGIQGQPGYGPPWARKHSNNGVVYAVAAIVPILILAIAGGVFFLCMRKRKRQKQNDGLPVVTQEMKVQPKTSTQPYLATPVSSPPYPSPNQLPPTSTPSQIQPVILGPILSSSNGAYLTGMDTSDVVSITSDSLRPINPFTDNSNITEPPPPYRPRSVAPPSFASTSRQSSLRASDPPPATSRTHLIEGSPFEDPEDDDVSELQDLR